ncbi:SAV_6107 family HEPN domain-containing protein [Streptomyces sp. XM4193]|uniref:SAV_6107 family HEPN domain-containing protein n=1 Tax=Streptomyces sp. XM4193 TaxID=2929782 RepID=UPI001FFA7A26|nr:SAV_6107 family HEPN domain-containing protein [Streptomyces sp. XM4193]MCK1796349.1 SAV_6107 family HEPN domain-containing protein [Streptomyces sp. XM4193]
MKVNGPPSETSPTPDPPVTPGSHPAPAGHPPAVSTAALSQLAQAHQALAEAAVLGPPHERYVAAHRAALHTAAAVLAVRGRPETSERARRRIRSAWDILREIAPELAEWSAYFASGASRRALAEAGVHGAVSGAHADELLRTAQEFRLLVERTLTIDSGLPHQRRQARPGRGSPARGRRPSASGGRQ